MSLFTVLCAKECTPEFIAVSAPVYCMCTATMDGNASYEKALKAAESFKATYKTATVDALEI